MRLDNPDLVFEGRQTYLEAWDRWLVFYANYCTKRPNWQPTIFR